MNTKCLFDNENIKTFVYRNIADSLGSEARTATITISPEEQQ